MPTPGLSLVGFLDEVRAVQHLEQACALTGLPREDLVAKWRFARTKLGAPISAAGTPAVLEMPPEATHHITALQRADWARSQLGAEPGFSEARFGLVEIDSVLAFQLSVQTERSQHHCGTGENGTPSLDEMLRICLPIVPGQEQFTTTLQPNALIVRARSLNVRLLQPGLFDNRFAGVLIGSGSPLVQVTIVEGRHYLWNGYHRAFGLRARGATYIPCTIKTALDHTSAAQILGREIPLATLMSDNPPTVGHFTSKPGS